MNKSVSQKMQDLKRVIRLHANWLVYAALGESALTKSEVTELEQYGKLPMGKTLDLVEKSYLLGRLRAVLKHSEYTNLNYENIVDTKPQMTPLEELVVEQARLRAGMSMKTVSQDIADGVYASLSQGLGKAVSEAMVSQTVADETALALIYKKTAQQLASDLATRLQTGQRKNWKSVAQTSMQAAKVAGSAQAIANKLGIYAFSDGPDSFVSVVPGAACCKDCTAHYIGADGQPRVFRLSTLMGAGSNSDSDVTHSKTNGQHTKWKTTLPPLHPSCGCMIKYVPPGYGWVGGKLNMLNKSLFMEHLSKASSGVSGGISPTVKPGGGESYAEDKSPGAGQGSLPGAAAPGNHPGPGRPSGGLPKPGSGTPGGMGGGKQLVACPLMHCPDGGQHHMDSAVLREHTAQAQRTGDFTPMAKESNEKQMNQEAEKFNETPHPHDVVLDHISNGKIGSAKDLSTEGTAGIHKTFKASIIGNGSGAMKPPPSYDDDVYTEDSSLLADGAASAPRNAGHKSEAGAYSLSRSLGLTDHVPPTVVRAHDGGHGIEPGSYSIQQWKDGHMPVSFGTDPTKKGTDTPADAKSGKSTMAKNNYAMLTQAANISGGEKAAKAMQEKLHEIAVLDIVMNNNDRHFGNIVMSPDRKDVTGIDHGLAFGSGMQGHKNGIHRAMDQAKRPLTVPDHLMSRFKTRSLGDTERGLEGSGLQPWQAIQTHLREKYVAHLQETHSYIPHEATRGVVSSCGGVSLALGHGWGGNSPATNHPEFKKALADNQTPDQLFASFSKDYITKGLADKSNPAHADFEKMAAAMPAHEPGKAWIDDYHGSEEHKKYWDSIPAYEGVKCKSFSEKYSKKEPEATKPLRTPPEIPPTRPGTDNVNAGYNKVAEDAPTPDKTVKPGRVRKAIWLDPAISFPLTELDLE